MKLTANEGGIALYIYVDTTHTTVSKSANTVWQIYSPSTGHYCSLFKNMSGEFRFRIYKGIIHLAGFGFLEEFNEAIIGTLSIGWHWIETTWDNDSIEIYCDGVLKTSLSDTMPIYEDSEFYLGIWYNGTAGYSGLLDEVVFFKEKRTADEILATSQSNQPIPITDKVSYKLDLDNNLYNKAYNLIKTLPSNTLTNNNEYKWMVRVWKNDTDYVDSNWAVFKTNTTPNVVLNLTEISSPTFSRNSTAYLSDGTLVNINLPRFESGKFGKAIMIEEGTTNLNSDPFFKTGVSGWGNLTWTTLEWLSSEYNPFSKQNGVMRLYDNDGNKGYCAKTFTINNTTHTVSVLLKILKGDINHINVGGVVSYTDSTYVDYTWNDSFTKRSDMSSIYGAGTYLLTATFTPNSSKTINRYELRISHNDTIETELLVYAVQLEAKPYPTSFIDGTRSPETLTIPNANIFNKSNWNLEFLFNPTSNQVVSGKTGYLWENYIDANNYYALKVGSDGKPYLEVKSNGILYQTSTSTAPVLNVGTQYDIKIRGNGSLMAIAVNGTKISEVSYVEPIGNLPTSMYIGSDHNGSNQANGLFDDLRISAIARSDTEWASDYQSGQPLPVDEWTTYKLNFDGSLNNQPKIILNSQSYTFTANYTQLESVSLGAYKFLLYDDSDNLLVDTKWLYDGNLSYEFGGLETGKSYKIECVVLAQNGMEVSSGKKEFLVSYDYPYNNFALITTPIKETGAIQVSWNLKQIIGQVTGNYLYTTGKFGQGIYLNSGSILQFKDNIPQDFTIPFYIKLPTGFTGTFLKLDDDFEVGYDGTRFYYKRQYRITAGNPVALPTGFFTVSVKGNKVIIRTDTCSEVIN